MNYEITCHSTGEGAQACREGRKKASVLHTPPPQTSAGAGASAAERSSTHAFIDPVSPIIAKKIIR